MWGARSEGGSCFNVRRPKWFARPELFRPDGIQKAFPKDKSTRFACKGICVAPGQPVCARHHRRNMVLKPPKEGRMNAEQLWADFSRPIVTADDYITSLSGRRM